MIKLTWDEIQLDCRTLVNFIRMHCPYPKGIIAIARGGLVPATIIGQILGTRRVETLCVSSYIDGIRVPAVILNSVDPTLRSETGWIIVDDLVDTGETARVAHALLPYMRYYALYAKPLGRPCASAVAREFPQDTWLEFPWERQL